MNHHQAFVLQTPLLLPARSTASTTRQPRHLYTPRKQAARLPPTARTKDVTQVEHRLLSKVSEMQQTLSDTSLHLYRKKRPDEFAAVSATAKDLERMGSGFGSGSSRLKSLLPGTWRLVLTDAAAVEKNSGSITGLGNLPGARCVRVEVRLMPDGKASTVEQVKVFAGLLDGQNSLEGKWRVAGNTLEVTYAQAVLMGKATVRADSKAVLKTTYCSSRVRIGRSSSNELYVFVKE